MSLQFLCPESSRNIDSGIEIDDATLRVVKHTMISVGCPACGRNHRFALSECVQEDKHAAAS